MLPQLELWFEQGFNFDLNDVVFLALERIVKHAHLICQHTSNNEYTTEPTMQIEGNLVCILPRRSYNVFKTPQLSTHGV